MCVEKRKDSPIYQDLADWYFPLFSAHIRKQIGFSIQCPYQIFSSAAEWKTSSNNSNSKQKKQQPTEWFDLLASGWSYLIRASITVADKNAYTRGEIGKNGPWKMIHYRHFDGFHYYNIYFRPFKKFTCCYAIHHFSPNTIPFYWINLNSVCLFISLFVCVFLSFTLSLKTAAV